MDQGFRQYIVLLLKYQQVPQQLRITATPSGLHDVPPLVPLIQYAWMAILVCDS